MPNRFSNPFDQFLNSAGVPYAGGKLYFYATASSTPLATYNDPDLAAPHANSNPVVLNSAGRLPNAVFLQTLAYKVTFTDANDAQVWTADPVADSDFTAFGKTQTYAGNPNGNVAGTAGSGSGVTQIPADLLWDRTNSLLYVCTTSGVAAVAVWTQVTTSSSGVFTSAVFYSGSISPTQLSADTNNWAPTGFSTAYQVRIALSAAWNLTGLAGGAGGRDILLTNISAFALTLKANSGSSSAGNQFLLDADLVLPATETASFYFDATSNGWRLANPYAANTAATQAQQETATSTATYVSPGRQQYHPSAAKCWAWVTVAGGTPTLAANYNITSITDSGLGDLTITIATDFSSGAWAAVLTSDPAGAFDQFTVIKAIAAGSVEVINYSVTGVGATDPNAYAFAGFGDQA